MGRSLLTSLAASAMALVLLAGCAATPAESPEPTPTATQVTSDDAEATAEPTEEEVAQIFDPWSLWDGYGTVFITSRAITKDSPSDFLAIDFTGIEARETYDRRVESWVTLDSWIFTASYQCGRPEVEVVVNPEFSEAEALEQATLFARVVGQMPIGARVGVDEIWVHDGIGAAGGGNNAINVHTEEISRELQWIEEIFVHEGGHTSLDYFWGGVVDETLWEEAVASDGQFISKYAADYPDREDIAESYGAFLIWALYRDYGLFPESAAGIEAKIPARLAYFESLGPDYGPLPASCGL